MAKIIKARRRRRSTGAKVAKKARRAARRVVVQTKKIYRSARGVNLSKKDIIISVAAGGAGAIGAAYVMQKLPETGPLAVKGVKNGLVAAAGGFLAYKGMKKRNWALASAGLGMAAAGAAGAIREFAPSLPGASTTTTAAAPYQRRALTFAAPISRRNMISAPYSAIAGAKVRDLSEMI